MSSRTVNSKYNTEFIPCSCGCKNTLSKYDKYGYERKFIDGHQMIGRHRTNKTKNKLRQIFKERYQGENNPNWSGDSVGKVGLHLWVRKHFSKPEKCMMCDKKPPKDLANITGIYNRDFNNWAYFCRKCHMLFDNIIERNLKPFTKDNYIKTDRDPKTGRFIKSQ